MPPRYLKKTLEDISPGGSAHVTQRPGWSCLATSVSTLTTGEQATVDFRLAGPRTGERFRTSSRNAAGKRMRMEVAESRSSRTDIVWLCPAGVLTLWTRSDLAPRLIQLAPLWLPSCPVAGRSLPDANGMAPNPTDTAVAPRIPETILDKKILDKKSLDMMEPGVAVQFAVRRSATQRGPRQQGSRILYHLTVCKNSSSKREQFWRFGVFSKAGYPPCPK